MWIAVNSASIMRIGARIKWHDQHMWTILTIVIENKLKMLISLDQKGMWTGIGVQVSPITDVAPPVERWGLNHSLAYTGNRVSPYFSQWDSEPKGKPMEVRIKDAGKSECPAVMAGIGFELRQHYPTRKCADFQQVYWHENICQKTMKVS